MATTTYKIVLITRGRNGKVIVGGGDTLGAISLDSIACWDTVEEAQTDMQTILAPAADAAAASSGN